MLPQVGFSQVLNRSFVERDSTVILLGQVTVDRFKEPPFSSWYLPGQSNETTPSDTLALLASAWEHIHSLTLFIGTWSGESRRGLPKIVSLLQAADFDMTNLKVICVDHSKSVYKQSPDGEQVGQNIHRVPTLLEHDEEGEEMNRIVEPPLFMGN
jgi:hypothetical protein